VSAQQGLLHAWGNGFVLVEPVVLLGAMAEVPWRRGVLVSMGLVIRVVFAIFEIDLGAVGLVARGWHADDVVSVGREHVSHPLHHLRNGGHFRVLDCVLDWVLQVGIGVQLSLAVTIVLGEDEVFEGSVNRDSFSSTMGECQLAILEWLACILILAATDLGGIAGPIGELDLDWFTGLVRSAVHGGASCLGKRGYKSCFSTFAQLADGDMLLGGWWVFGVFDARPLGGVAQSLLPSLVQVRVGALPLNGEIVAQVGRDVKAVLSSGVLDWVITGPLPEFTWIQEVKFGCKHKSRSAMI